jgi:hypothetical protein
MPSPKSGPEKSPQKATLHHDMPARRRLRPRRLAVLAAAAIALAGAITVTAAELAPGAASSGMAGGHAAAGRSVPAARQGSSANGHQATASAATRSDPGASTAGGQQANSPGAAQSTKAQSQGRHSRSAALRTSCRSVAHIGDSTSVDLISRDFIPNAAQRLGARYTAVGIKHVKIDASGGRSIVEELPAQLNGYKVASAWRNHGYRGCWVFALGTNDTANIAAGSRVGMMARIDQMMAVAHGQPVMWVNTRTLLSTGPWANANEQAWDKTLVKALAKYPNMRIFNWSAVARPSWFLSDGIHYNSAGCAMRAKAIANALARAFPQHGQSVRKIVR